MCYPEQSPSSKLTREKLLIHRRWGKKYKPKSSTGNDIDLKSHRHFYLVRADSYCGSFLFKSQNFHLLLKVFFDSWVDKHILDVGV